MAKTKKKWPLFVGLGLGIPILLGVGLFGAIKAGVIKSPLVSNTPPAQAETEKPETEPITTEEETTIPTEPEFEPETEEEEPAEPAPKFVEDPEIGAAEIALIWAGIEPSTIAEMSSAYKDAELARIVSKMNAKKAGAVLSALKPERAAKVSREIEKQASLVPIEEDLF